MIIDIKNRVLWFGFLGLFFLCFLATAAIFAALLNQERKVIDYPGAIKLSDHNTVTYPLSYRQDASYITDDEFPLVYNWYSRGFSLGPERQAQSRCIHMYNERNTFAVHRVMTVTVCDTPNGRMIFVHRSFRIVSS